jgi:hypothetical protein
VGIFGKYDAGDPGIGIIPHVSAIAFPELDDELSLGIDLISTPNR